jgi:adenine-specific DNA-methyltransferase
MLKEMLKNEGFIVFHTIEPNYAKVKQILNEIFGEENHQGTFIWKKFENSVLYPGKVENKEDYYKNDYDFIILYCKNKDAMRFNKFPPEDKLYKNPDNDPRGKWESRPIIASEKSSNEVYTYIFKNGLILTRKFRYARETLEQYEKENRLHFTKPKKGDGIPRLKIFFKERMEIYKKSGKKGTTPNTLWIESAEYGSIQALRDKLKKHPTISINHPYRTEKLYKKLIQMTTLENDLIFDCFCQAGVVLKCIQELNRRWLGAEANLRNIRDGILPWLTSSINFLVGKIFLEIQAVTIKKSKERLVTYGFNSF